MTELMLTRDRLRNELDQHINTYHQCCDKSVAKPKSAGRRRAIEEVEVQIHIAEQYLATLSFRMWDSHQSQIIRHWNALNHEINGLQATA